MLILGYYVINLQSYFKATNGVVFKKDKIKCTENGIIDRFTQLSCKTCNKSKSKFENMMELCSIMYKKKKLCKAIATRLIGDKISYSPCLKFTTDLTLPLPGGYIDNTL